MVLDERENRILDFLVRDYVRTAEPVSSLRVREGLCLKESPATVRSLIADMSEDGFFEQPHISAGRVPTDLAYRYFVDNLILGEPREKVFSAKKKVLDEAEAISRFFSEALGLLSFASRQGERFSGRGFSRLLEEPEFSDAELVRDIGHLADNINEIAEVYRDELKKESEVFIGKENPLKEAKELSVFYSESERGSKKGIIVLVGPKRVNYEQISNFMNKFLEEF